MLSLDVSVLHAVPRIDNRRILNDHLWHFDGLWIEHFWLCNDCLGILLLLHATALSRWVSHVEHGEVGLWFAGS